MTTTIPGPDAAVATRRPGAAAIGDDRLLPRVVRLEAGRVRVRPAHHGDGPVLQALLGRMSVRTRWLRFHSPVVQFTPAQLRSLVEADHRDHETLLAEVELDGRWHLAGFAQYHRLGEGERHAESAIALADAWQRRGIGGVLARCLAEAASRAGITAFTGEVLSENHGALGFISGLTPRLERRLHGTTIELVCWLSRRPDASSTPSPDRRPQPGR